MGRNSALHVRRSSPPSVDVAIAAVAARQHGVVALDQLRALGLSARTVQQRAANGRLHRVHRGTYAVGHRGLGVEGRRWAAVLACGPGAALSHRSAADAWALRRSASPAVEVTTAARGRTGPAAVCLHRTRTLHAADVTTRDGLPITTVARTLVDLAGILPAAKLERAVHQADVLRLLDAHEVHEAIERAPGRRGTAALRRLLAEPAAGVTRSDLEERFLALLRGTDLRRPHLNAHVPTKALGLVEVDVLWAAERLVVELDGAGAHHTRRAFHHDRRKDAALVAAGWRVMRLTSTRVDHDAAAVVAEVRAALTGPR